MFKEQEADTLVCLDGQQRVTTSVLLVAAGRDALLRYGQQRTRDQDDERLQKCVRTVESVLYNDVDAAHRWADDVVARCSTSTTTTTIESAIAVGERLPFCRLVPSHADRKPFFDLIVGGLFPQRTNSMTTATTSTSAAKSIQADTKHYFDAQFARLVEKCDTPLAAIETIVRRLTQALGVQFMMINPLGDKVNSAQLYQWLQEKSLLSMGALLYNPVRNG